MTADSLALWVGAIRAQEKHDAGCAYSWGPVPNVGPTAHHDCTCDQSQRADARVARVLREAVKACGAKCSDRDYEDKFPDGENAALAVVERAAQEGEK